MSLPFAQPGSMDMRWNEMEWIYDCLNFPFACLAALIRELQDGILMSLSVRVLS